MSESELVECPYCQAVTTVDECDFNKRLLCPNCNRPYAVGDAPMEPAIPKVKPELWEAKGSRIIEKMLEGMKSAALSIQTAAAEASRSAAAREHERACIAARIAETPEAKLWAARWPYDLMTAVLVIAAVLFAMGSVGNSRFQSDNTYGATANSVEGLPFAIGSGTCLICAFLCRVVVAIKLIHYER